MEKVQVVPAEKARTLLQRARDAAAFPQEIPRGWSKSRVNPLELLTVFDSLRLKKGITLRAYQYRESSGGNAVVYAMPENTPFSEPAECEPDANRFLDPPVPPGALDDIMEAVEGDGSPWSYFSASLLARELMEFGAFWHGCSWSTHTIVDKEMPVKQTESLLRRKSGQDPDSPDVGIDVGQDEWEWLSPKPEDWDPIVRMSDELVTVTFYTISKLGVAAIYKHVDSYQTGSYSLESETALIAQGPGGYKF